MRTGNLAEPRRADRNLAIAFGTLVAILMALVLFFGRSLSASFHEKNSRDTEQSTVQLLSAAVERVSYSGKFHARLLLEDIVRENENIRYAILADAEGLVLAHSDPSKNGQHLDAHHRAVASSVLSRSETVFTSHQHEGAEVREIAALYRGGFDGREEGVVFLGLSQAEHEERERSAFLLLAIAVVILTLLSVVAVFWLSRRFGLGIRRMASQLDGILSRSPVLIRIDDEEGVVARSHTYRHAELDESSLEDALSESLDENTRSSKTEWVNADGESYSLSRFPIELESDQKSEQYCLIGLNTTAQELAREQLRDSERRLRITLDSIADAVVAVNPEGRVERVNPVATELLASSEDELLGRPIDEVLDMRSVDAKDQRLPWSGEFVMDERFVERPKLHSLRVEIASTPMRDEAQTLVGYVIIFRDITEKHRIERELWQAAKEESIGKLAGGIAHDFNNMLTGMLGATYLLRRELETPSSSTDNRELLSLVQLVSSTAEKAGGMTRQLLAFSRKTQGAFAAQSVHELIDETVMLLRRSIDKRITVETVLECEEDLVLADAAALQNALLNLGINARDAVKGQGTICYRTRAVSLDGAECDANDARRAIEIRVSDTGEGIPEEALPRIFEPYFTTKAIGEGTGLGLASVRGTVQSLGGSIRVDSRQEEGTTFTVVLPLHEGERALEDQRVASREHGKGRILIVDDEEAVRRTAMLSLEDAGYEVQEATDGQDALDIIQADGTAFDLVITDLIMPRLNGYDFVVALREMRPNLPVVLVSGYSADLDMDDLRRKGLAAILIKPYQPEQLLEAVAEALASSL